MGESDRRRSVKHPDVPTGPAPASPKATFDRRFQVPSVTGTSLSYAVPVTPSGLVTEGLPPGSSRSHPTVRQKVSS